ncbi:MAG: uroporphyrinogen-III synthase [Polyangiales bacterium]
MTVRVALRVVTLESRNAAEMARLLERHGLCPISAPALREVPLEDQAAAFEFGEALMRGECDLLLLLTGVGTRALFSALCTRWPEAHVLAALSRVALACRGPKPVAVLKPLGLRPAVIAHEPNTWRDLVEALRPLELARKRVWVQEYGRPNPELVEALRGRGAEVRSAAVYAWRLPEDVEPLRSAIARLCDGDADAIAFTSARQIDHLLEVASTMGARDTLLSALRTRVVVASIGPVTSEALVEHGLRADIEPEHPKMGHLVKALAERGVRALSDKREPR